MVKWAEIRHSPQPVIVEVNFLDVRDELHRAVDRPNVVVAKVNDFNFGPALIEREAVVNWFRK